RLRQGDARFHPPNHFEKMIAALRRFLRRERDWHPDLVPPVSERREADTVRQDANDRVAFTVKGQRAADDAWIASESPLPQALVQKSDFRPRFVFVRNKSATEDCFHA